MTTALFNQLKALYPVRNAVSTNVLANPWYIVVAVAFSASNKAEAVPQVFEHMMKEIPAETRAEDQRLLAKKLREALFKSGLVSGYPRAINSLRALHEAMPEELRDTEIHRDTTASLAEYQHKGELLFDSLYGETAGSVQGLLDTIYPDLGWFSKTIGYGLTYGTVDILSPLETSFTLVSALIAGDTPQQISWHLAGARRCGASSEEVQAVRRIAIEVAKQSGIQWKNPIPEVDL